jgi:hypothetical protein
LTQTQRGVATNIATAAQDLGDSVWRHGDFARQHGRRDANLSQFVTEYFAGMDSLTKHSYAPST